MAQTYFDFVTRDTENERERIIHTIKQFVWFRDAMGRTLINHDYDLDEKNESRMLNAVRFDLPYSPGREIPGYLLTAGNGCNKFDVYLANVSFGFDLLSENFLKQPSELWRIFSYEGSRQHKYAFEEEPQETIKLNEIFTTDLSPFLKGGDYPLDCLRVYNLYPNWMSDMLQVTADNRKDRSKQNLKVTYLPDYRDGEPITLVTLKKEIGKGWISSDLEDKISTRNFTFSSTFNA